MLQRDYRDPLEVLIAREGATCKGCVYERAERVFEIKVMTCAKNRKHGKKCTNYKERE